MVDIENGSWHKLNKSNFDNIISDRLLFLWDTQVNIMTKNVTELFRIKFDVFKMYLFDTKIYNQIYIFDR